MDFVSFRNKMVENSEVHVVKAVHRGQNEGPEADGSKKLFHNVLAIPWLTLERWNRTTDPDSQG